MHRSTRWLYAFSTVVLILCLSCQRGQKPETRMNDLQTVTGDGWLAWSPAERTEYIDTYLDAYSTAYYDACRSAEDVFIEESSSAKGAHMAKLPYEKGDENSTDIPLSHCMNRRAKYSRRQRGPDVLFVSPYPEIITEMYEKHPDARSAPYFLLLTLLSDGGAQTAEDLYKDQLGKWPNARYEPR
jgi:hypothetical protein